MADLMPYEDEREWAMEDFENAYRNWMAKRMHASKYMILFDLLYDATFTWKADIPRDEDRAANGRYLRARFSEETGMRMDDSWLEWECRFLEFLVALAFSIEDNILYDPENPGQEADVFWEMMDNCGLSRFDDDEMRNSGYLGYATASEIMQMIMDRRYDKNGNKGLFPLARPAMDQRKVEIWYQANAYAMENWL